MDTWGLTSGFYANVPLPAPVSEALTSYAEAHGTTPTSAMEEIVEDCLDRIDSRNYQRKSLDDRVGTRVGSVSRVVHRPVWLPELVGRSVVDLATRSKTTPAELLSDLLVDCLDEESPVGKNGRY